MRTAGKCKNEGERNDPCDDSHYILHDTLILAVPIIQSLAQLEKNYGKEGAEIIQDNVQDLRHEVA